MKTVEVKLTFEIPCDDLHLESIVNEAVVCIFGQYHAYQALKAASEYAKTDNIKWNEIMLYHEYWYNLMKNMKAEICIS